MTISVAIPAYNSSAVIRATIESVLQQTLQPDEILVLDDGSTDDTVELLKSYEPQVRVFRQQNQGVAAARNTLCRLAKGDLIAFLDHDDLWHPRYLEVQISLFKRYPTAVAFVTAHVDFSGYGNYRWHGRPFNSSADAEVIKSEVIQPLDFFKRYNKATGPFASMSYCCVPSWVIQKLDSEAFRVSGVDDSYFFSLAILFGPVVYAPLPLVAYRMTDEAQSADHLGSFGLWLSVFSLLRERYAKLGDAKCLAAFDEAFASKRRAYSKFLMGDGKTSEARTQIWHSMRNSSNPKSLAKSLGLLISTYLPPPLRPRWPARRRKNSVPSDNQGCGQCGEEM